jgi:hypothetical protein
MQNAESDNCRNKRNFARVKTTLPIKVRIVFPENECSLESGIEGNRAIQFNPPQALNDPAIYEWVKFIDAKLDVILQQIFENKNLFDMPLEVCELSGSGMSIISPDKFSIGDTLELKVLYPLSPTHILRLYGNVVRSEKVADGYLTALRFTIIDDSVRDKIIRLVFDKERETIRKKRGE